MSTPWEIADRAQSMLREAASAREQAGRLLAEAARHRDELAGLALWCSTGEHAFSSADRRRAMFKVETHLMCGPHADERRTALAKPVPPKALPNGVDQDEYRRYLEWKAGLGPEPGAANPGSGVPGE